MLMLERDPDKPQLEFVVRMREILENPIASNLLQKYSCISDKNIEMLIDPTGSVFRKLICPEPNKTELAICELSAKIEGALSKNEGVYEKKSRLRRNRMLKRQNSEGNLVVGPLYLNFEQLTQNVILNPIQISGEKKLSSHRFDYDDVHEVVDIE
jgi:hypothetical protein